MALRINDEIPNLTVTTDLGELSLHDWIGDSWAILFSHPKDFTPVCTTEFGAVAQLADEWEKRGTKVMGISVDSAEDHTKWKGDIETAGSAAPGFPIIADNDLTVAKAFDMLPAEYVLPDGRTPADSATVRVVFIIGPDKKLKLSMTYPMTVGLSRRSTWPRPLRVTHNHKNTSTSYRKLWTVRIKSPSSGSLWVCSVWILPRVWTRRSTVFCLKQKITVSRKSGSRSSLG